MIIKFSEKPNYQNVIIFVNKAGDILVSNTWKDKNKKTVSFLKDFISSAKFGKSKELLHHIFAQDLTEILLVAIDNTPKQLSFLKIGGKLGKTVLKCKFKDVALVFPDQNSRDKRLANNLQSILEGLLLGCYEYNAFQTDKSQARVFKTLIINCKKNKTLGQQVDNAKIMAESANVSRDCSNKPGNHFLPVDFKKVCQQVAKETSLKFEALSENQMKKLNMNCLLGVSQGSENPAYLNIMSYQTKNKKAQTLMLVGKGITFDSGGISLKPSLGMGEMKHDMSGGAAVLGAMRIIGLMKPDVNVIGLIPAVENLPDGKAFRPGDVLTASNGKTVEIGSTDAEGRLILCDALAYGIKRFKPDAVVDIATLTGACVVALGSYNIGMIPNNPDITARLKAAGSQTEEYVWEMPANDEYEELIKSKIADLNNIGGRWGGMITAGIFLRHFVGKTPWAHLDIAGVSNDVKHIDFQPDHGATGSGARLLAQLALNWTSK
ncbi:MAG: leucyl aminopeptidase [Deltaproteobacteria bacterium]|nr:leucyl aminopeptidase [Deltaproteobacteria bacterium]